MNRKIAALTFALFLIAGVLPACEKKREEGPSGDETTTTLSSKETVRTGKETETEVSWETRKEEYPKEGITNTGVNFRTGPGTENSIIELLQNQIPVTVLGEEKGWYRVKVHEREGYISKEYVDIAEEPPTKNSETSEKSDEESPSSESEKQGTLQGDGTLTDSGLFSDVLSLPNKSIPYGNDWENKDANGLPNGIYYYEGLYSRYYPVYRIKTSEKLIYLTFDEGYEAGYTPLILDTLKEKNVKAVFFLTKQFLDSDPELVQRMISEGHILGNHTCLHPSGGYPNYVEQNGLQSFIDDVSRLHRMVWEQYGYEMRLFRFPEGESSERLMAEMDNLGYTSVFWTYAHRDFVQTDQPEVSVTLERCLSHLAPGSVYLLHAVSSSNTAALADFIDQARAAGYDFGTFPVEEVSKR